MSNIKLICYLYKGEKKKNKGISRGGLVIRLIAIMERFLSKILEQPYLIYMTFHKVK